MSEQPSEKNVLSRTMEILRNARNALQELENSVTGSTIGEHEQYFINLINSDRLRDSHVRVLAVFRVFSEFCSH